MVGGEASPQCSKFKSQSWGGKEFIFVAEGGFQGCQDLGSSYVFKYLNFYFF